MTLLPQVRDQLDSAARRRSARPHRLAPLQGAFRRLLPGRAPGLNVLVAALSVAVALIVGGGAIVLLGHRRQTAHPRSTSTTASTSKAIREIERYAGSQFAIFDRPQTAKDRSLPALARRAIRLGDLGSGFKSELDGWIPSLTRYTQTISGDREVFITAVKPDEFLPGRLRRRLQLHDRSAEPQLVLGVVIVQPDGRWTDGQPLTGRAGGMSARDAYITARTGQQACGLDTYPVIVPNEVARIRWQFARQDSYGYVYKAPLTVNLTVHGNVAVATIPQRASCDRPAAITLYGRDGVTLSHTGTTRNLDRITRPVKHGDPLLYWQFLRRPERSAARRPAHRHRRP